MERAFQSIEDTGIEPDYSARVQETMNLEDLENREAVTRGRSAPDWSAM